MGFHEDLSLFFQVFSTEAIINNKSIIGLFNHHYHCVEDLALIQPAFICIEMDVLAVSVGDNLIIDQKKYAIKEKKPDGTGLITLILGDA